MFTEKIITVNKDYYDKVVSDLFYVIHAGGLPLF